MVIMIHADDRGGERFVVVEEEVVVGGGRGLEEEEKNIQTHPKRIQVLSPDSQT